MRCSDRNRCKEGNDTTETLIAGHTILLAHAAAVAVYRELAQGGQITIVVSDAYGIPYSDKPEDVAAAERSNIFTFSHWSDPVVFGDYPQEMKDALGVLLPSFTAAEQKTLKGSIDFFALNHYSSRWVYYDTKGGPCQCTQTAFNSSGAAIGPVGASDWLYIYPPGLRGAINWVWRRYQLPVMVTENGLDRQGEDNMTLAEQLNDVERVDYYRGYISNVGLAISEDGVPVKGYFLWSLMDNMEWGSAFTLKFGIVRVDCASKDLSRYVKRSAQFYSGYIVQQREATKAAAAAALAQPGSLSRSSFKAERVVQEIPIVEPLQW
jgi:beta-glucosidase